MSTRPPPASRSLIIWNRHEVRYELQQPDPGHWAAIGVLQIAAPSDSTPQPTLIVGRGRTEADAICDLRSRAMARCPVPADMHGQFSVEWSPTGCGQEGGTSCSTEGTTDY